MALVDIIPRFKSYFKKDGAGLHTFMEFKLHSQRFVDILGKIDMKWNIVISYDRLISNQETGENIPSLIEKGKKKGLMEAYHKKWIALALALDLFRILATNMQRFVSEKDAYLARIKALDLELALKLEPLVLSPQEGLEFLAPIKGILNNPQMVISYIKTHYDELMQKIDRMKYKETAEELRRIVVILSNRETEELLRCINDVKSWPYRGAYGINLYIERTFLFLNGGKSKYDGEAFLGFRLHFRDKELVTVLLKAPQFRKLMTYRQEIEFFVEARNAIQKSVETEGKWEGFYAFYNKLDENIRKVRDVYGNDQFAKILEVFKEKKHEAPIDWENELYMLYEDLIKKAYQLVVEPAARALIGIFEARIKKIEEGKVSALNELRKLLKEKDELYKTKREFAKILRKKRERLLSELKKDRLEFEALIREIVLAMPEFESKFNQITQHKNLVRDLLVEFAILDTSIAWENFTSSNMVVVDNNESSLENDNTSKMLARGLSGMYNRLNAAGKEKKNKSRIEKKLRQDLLLINELFLLSKNRILPQIIICVNHINSKLDGYVPETNAILKRIAISRTQNRAKIFELGQREKQIGNVTPDKTEEEFRQAA